MPLHLRPSIPLWTTYRGVYYKLVQCEHTRRVDHRNCSALSDYVTSELGPGSSFMSCLPQCPAIARYRPRHNSTFHFRNGASGRSLPEMCPVRHNVAAALLSCFCDPGSPIGKGRRPVPSALGWPCAMYATPVCGHSGVVLLGGCRFSLGCKRLSSTVLATSRHDLLSAYTGEAGMLRRNCCASEEAFRGLGGDGGGVADLSVVLAVDPVHSQTSAPNN